MAANALILLLVLAVASPAAAEVLAFDGRLVAVLPGLGEAEIASGPGVAQVDGVDLRSLDILSADITGSAGVPVTDPTAAPVTSIRVSASLPTGHLGIDVSAPPFSEPVLTARTLPMPGQLQVCMLIAPLPPCIGGFAMPLTKSSGAVGVGVGGLITFGGSATVRVSLYGAPFTLNTAFATGATSNGAPFTLLSSGSLGGPHSFTSTAGQPGGFLSIVTPIRAAGFQDGQPANLVPGFLRFELRFVPEPGPALLLASGATGLVLLGRARRLPRARSHPPRTERRDP